MNTVGKYMGVYHRDTPRAPWWQYTRRGVYLVRMELLAPESGFLLRDTSAPKLNNVGIVADMVWQGLRARHTNVEWREYALGSAWFHGIIAIVDDLAPRVVPPVTIHPDYVPNVIEEYGISGRLEPSNQFMSSISPDHRSLGALVRTFKGEVTKHCKRLGLEMKWRPRYSDRMLRDALSYETARAFLEDVGKGEEGRWLKGRVRRGWGEEPNGSG